MDVVAVGNAIVDVLASADDEFLARHEMTKGSMQLIDADIAHALYGDIGPGVESSGGSAANTAAGIASLGGTPGFIGRVAADVRGEVFTHDLRRPECGSSPWTWSRTTEAPRFVSFS